MTSFDLSGLEELPRRPFGWLGCGGLGEGYVCRGCGCTDERACPGGCAWTEADLCSTCAEAGARLRRRVVLGLAVVAAFVAGFWSAIGVLELMKAGIVHVG